MNFLKHISQKLSICDKCKNQISVKLKSKWVSSSDGTLGLQVRCTTILLLDEESGECTVKPKDTAEAIMSELDYRDFSYYFFVISENMYFLGRYVNYDWEDARDRNLRDGRDSYFRSRWLISRSPSMSFSRSR